MTKPMDKGSIIIRFVMRNKTIKIVVTMWNSEKCATFNLLKIFKI